jgi:demethylmenaquinone methyltransferase/2-methoxy-6-polyprenyl-1,4-benzoquinol methylase
VNTKNKPDIETSGITARFYDQLIVVFTVGLYHNLLKRIIAALNIQPGDRVLDMGAGTGKNALLMNRYVNGGSITALEIGPEMCRQFSRKCKKYGNIVLERKRIDKPLAYRDRFDRVFISFVLHGFDHDDRARILHNAFQCLKPGGKLHIFDWNSFEIRESGPLMRFFMNHIECEPAINFIKEDLEAILLKTGFHGAENILYFKKQIRLLTVMK